MTQFQYLNGGNTEAQDKLATSFLLAQSATGKATTGVLTGLAVSQTTTASGSVQVGAGAGVVQAAVLDGADILVNDSTYTLDVLTPNPYGGVPRNDIVVFDTATTSIRSITGTPNATPTDPTVPSSAIPLARLRITASSIPTSAIDDLRTYTTLFQSTASTASVVPTAGFYDTPTLSYNLNGSTPSTTPGLNVVKKGGHVTMNGNIRRTGASFSNADTLIGNVPDGYRPTDVQRGTVTSGSSTYTLIVLTSGDVWLVNATLNSGNSVVPHLTWPAP